MIWGEIDMLLAGFVRMAPLCITIPTKGQGQADEVKLGFRVSPMPGMMWNRSLTFLSTAVVMILT